MEVGSQDWLFSSSYFSLWHHGPSNLISFVCEPMALEVEEGFWWVLHQKESWMPGPWRKTF